MSAKEFRALSDMFYRPMISLLTMLLPFYQVQLCTVYVLLIDDFAPDDVVAV
jgi:hypothetical protein